METQDTGIVATSEPNSIHHANHERDTRASGSASKRKRGRTATACSQCHSRKQKVNLLSAKDMIVLTAPSAIIRGHVQTAYDEVCRMLVTQFQEKLIRPIGKRLKLRTPKQSLTAIYLR